MDFLYTKTALFRTAEFIGADNEAKGTWLCVMGYCAEQENSGRIVGAAKWEDKQWQRACGVDFDDVKQAFPLIRVEGDDVVAIGYPEEKQREVQRMRAGGKKGAKSKWEPTPSTPEATPHQAPHQAPHVEATKTGDGEASTDRGDKIDRSDESVGSLPFLVELFLESHPACGACNRMAVENMLRPEDPKAVMEAISAFSTQWAGSDFPRSNPPLKEFARYLRNSGRISGGKKEKQGGDAGAVTERKQRFEGRSASDD